MGGRFIERMTHIFIGSSLSKLFGVEGKEASNFELRWMNKNESN